MAYKSRRGKWSRRESRNEWGNRSQSSVRRSKQDSRKPNNRKRDNAKFVTINTLRQALWVLENMEVGENGQFKVKSSGGGEQVYEFDAAKCTCEGFKWRGVCKHVVAAVLYEAVRIISERSQGRVAEDGEGE